MYMTGSSLGLPAIHTLTMSAWLRPYPKQVTWHRDPQPRRTPPLSLDNLGDTAMQGVATDSIFKKRRSE